MVAEDALQIELGIDVPVVGLGPGHGAIVAGIDDEDRIRGPIGNLLNLDAFGTREDRRLAARGQVSRLARSARLELPLGQW